MKALQADALCRVLETKLEAEKAKLAQLVKSEKDLRKQLQDLIHSRNAAATRNPAADDPALKSGADLRWQRWIESRRGLLNQELASLLARRSRQTDIVRKAFGRHAAMATLRDRQIRKEAIQQSRRTMFD